MPHEVVYLELLLNPGILSCCASIHSVCTALKVFNSTVTVRSDRVNCPSSVPAAGESAVCSHLRQGGVYNGTADNGVVSCLHDPRRVDGGGVAGHSFSDPFPGMLASPAGEEKVESEPVNWC